MGYLLAGLMGFIAGFMVNYLSDVLPIQRKFAVPACTNCGKQYLLKDYLMLDDCRHCGAPRTWRTYTCIIAGVVFSLALWQFPPVRMGYWLSFFVLFYFGVVIVIDIEHRLILHMVSLAGAVLGVITGTIRYNLITSLLGGLTGLLVMLVFYLFGVVFARYRARKLGHDDGEEALGFGDVTISAVLGLMLGWPLVLYGLMIGILAGGLISLGLVIFLIVTRRYESMTVFTAYGPYLVMGAVILLYFPKFLSFLSGN